MALMQLNELRDYLKQLLGMARSSMQQANEAGNYMHYIYYKSRVDALMLVIELISDEIKEKMDEERPPERK